MEALKISYRVKLAAIRACLGLLARFDLTACGISLLGTLASEDKGGRLIPCFPRLCRRQFRSESLQ